MPGGLTGGFIDGCRTGAMASNTIYGANMELKNYIDYVPSGSF